MKSAGDVPGRYMSVSSASFHEDLVEGRQGGSYMEVVTVKQRVLYLTLRQALRRNFLPLNTLLTEVRSTLGNLCLKPNEE